MSDDLSNPATKGELQAVQATLQADIQAVQTGLQANIQAVQTALQAEIQAVKAELKSDMQALRDELVEAIHGGQTELLKAFGGFTQTVQDRFQEGDQTEAALKRRMTMLESRLLEIEKRLNMPPAA